jgi:predicted Zn finger-like uncharacterized protein
MPEVVSCPECAKKLRVPDNLIGKDVKCPTCGHTFTAVIPSSAPPPPPKEEKEEEEPTYRVLRRRDEEEDRPRRRSRRVDEDEDDEPRRSRPRRYDDDEDDDDYARRRYLAPHRGGTVLTLGILSLVFSCFCCLVSLPMGIASISMGSNDLSAMNDGRMDSTGRGLTLAGLICGVISIVLTVVSVIFYVIVQANNPGGMGAPRRF